MTKDINNPNPLSVFISYSWDSEEHKIWTKELAKRLRQNGVNIILDQWGVAPGDQLPQFMETAIRKNNYILIICTPKYKEKSDKRTGGVGYEGDIMTGELLTSGNNKKFIPILRSGNWEISIPSWLKGKYSIDLSTNPYSEEQYNDLLVTLFNQREQAPPIGKPPQFKKSIREEAKKFYPTKENTTEDFDPIKIKGILVDKVGQPKNDGTRGSALYAIPFKLNRTPTHEWGELFIKTWDHPPRYTTMHRSGIARVQGDQIILTRTTIEEVRDTHRDTLKLVIDSVNEKIMTIIQKRRDTEKTKALQEQKHQDNLRNIVDDIKFD